MSYSRQRNMEVLMRGKKKSLPRKHFTLLEMLIVFGLIAILFGMALLMPNDTNAVPRTRSLIKKLELAMESYRVKYGFYIPASDMWRGFYTDDPGFKEFIDYEEMHSMGDIILSGGRPLVIDAFGKPIEYRCPGLKNRSRFDLLSYGPDGASPDASGLNLNCHDKSKGVDDIKNW